MGERGLLGVAPFPHAILNKKDVTCLCITETEKKWAADRDTYTVIHRATDSANYPETTTINSTSRQHPSFPPP